jgi:UDP-N-acetylmuramoylalanine--D-glutamate ligase
MAKLFQGKRVAVIGLGLSGLSTVRYLLKHGVKPVLMDTRLKVPGLELIATEKVDGIYLGELDANRLARMDILVVSPGLDLQQPAIRFAIAQGVHIIGDVELFALANQKPVLGITGSNGKSTVTMLVTEMLKQSGVNAIAAGNIGLPVLDALAMDDAEVYVLELSSFQLDTTHSLALRAAVNLNVTEDHLDRHGSMAAYAAAKQRIFLHCDLAVYNAEDNLTLPQLTFQPQASQPHAGSATTLGLSFDASHTGYGIVDVASVSGEQTLLPWLMVAGEKLMPLSDIRLVGRHNYFNALAAAALALQAGASLDGIKQALAQFNALPHRCTLVSQHQQVRWINDSKATNVGATLAAIAGLKPDVQGRLWLIAGGDGKGADFTELAHVLERDVYQVLTLGKDGPAIAACISHSVAVPDIAAAVKYAASHVQAGDVVLLSPACASLDMFKNYEERGQVFTDAVLRYWS